MNNPTLKRSLNSLFCLLMLVMLPGCPVNLNRVSGTTEKLCETGTDYPYYLYVPSWHNNDAKWPVVVTCHGTNPYDTAWAQIHEWRALAEQYGLLVVSPVLKATDSHRTWSAEDQVRRQREDEEAILAMVRKTINSLNGDPDRVYLVGWSGGAYDVYYTGLRHPNVFRALAVRMGCFDEKFLPDVADKIDPYQPMMICMASGDLPGIGPQCREGYEWFKKQGMQRVYLREVPGTHERKPRIAFDFFWDVTRKYSYIRLNAIKDVGGDPLKVQFYGNVDPDPVGVIWDFGDKQMSNEAAPQHGYAKPGTYLVKLTVINQQGARTSRTLELTLSE